MNREKTRHIGLAVILLIAGVLISAIGVIAWKSLSGPPYYYRDPGRAGDSAAYDKVMDPTLVNISDYEGVFESITVQTNESDISITIPYYQGARDYIDNASYEYHTLEPGEAFESEEGRIWLDHIAVAYGEFEPDSLNDYSVRLPARFFDANLEEVSGPGIPEIAPNDWDRRLSFRGQFPAIRFVLKGELTEEVKTLSPEVYDALTLSRLHSGASWGGDFESGYQANFDLRIWNPAPVDLVIDLAFGPSEIIEFPAEAGEIASLPDGKIMLAVKAENMDGLSTRSSTSNNSTTTTISISPKTSNLDRTTTCLMFLVLPIASGFPVDIDFLDGQGELIQGGGRSSSGLVIQKTPEAAAEDIRTVRIKYYPNRKRLIFRIPQIPGLPEENRNVDNLFDVRIPYVRINRIYEFRDAVQPLTQLDFKRNRNPANNAFVGPMVFEDITVKELVDEYAKLYGPTHGAEIDQENLTIEFLDMSLKARALRLWEEMKTSF